MFLSPHESSEAPRHRVYYTPKRGASEIVRALETIAPWSNDSTSECPYPGRLAQWRKVLGNLPRPTIHAWRSGRRKMPQWARDTLAAHLEREAFTRLEIAKELRKPTPAGKNEKSPP